MTELDVDTRCEMSCEILRNTKIYMRDLDPRHLWLVQKAVNGHLNDDQWNLFLCPEVTMQANVTLHINLGNYPLSTRTS